MSFNVAKSKVLRIARKTKHKIAAKYLMSAFNKPKSDIKVPRSKAASNINRPTGSYESLSEISSDKYLCFTLDVLLSFDSHENKLDSRATKLLNIFTCVFLQSHRTTTSRIRIAGLEPPCLAQ